MAEHTLSGRHPSEVTWFQRRQTLQAAAAWVAAGGWSAAAAQQRSNIVELEGDAILNGSALRPDTTIQTGDVIETGPRSRLVFVIGNSSFHVRQNSRLAVERGASLNAVSLLRLLTGAVVSVWGKGQSRRIVTPTLTAGIRGTGVYTEIFADRDNRSYLCNCYGTIDLSTSNDKVTSQAEYHQAFWADRRGSEEVVLSPAKAINHTDEELEFLARLVQQRTAWQISGKKGSKESGTY
ncbi:MAG TPA: iron dicitrate transport regulator FecR [Burkholderiaceae bacterium]|nr:iron dicitrate transport regulator FecR [Burkholderiaceae bacterium]